ncbi:hypothetical protein LTS08_007909 [Lithohypha guttulata]|nr:hypothetical protein LTS08_007909 [Lithohypha guttulata]
MAMTSGLFRELDNHTLEHTAISKDLRQGSPFLHAVTFLTETASITANKMVDMTKQYGSSSAQNHTAFNIAFDTDLPFYAYSSKDPKLSTQLAGSMKFFGVGGELHLKHLVNGYDWESLGDAKVVDVGGSQGHASIALASTFPNLSFIVQDLPEVIDRAKKSRTTSPPDPAVASRVSFEVHNFFQPQPPSSHSADVFLARLVLNNWHDNEAAFILRNLVSVMKSSARIVIMSAVLPDPGAVNLREEAIERTRDMFMMQAMNGTERGLLEWKDLFKQTDQRLILKKMTKPEGSNLSVLEVVLGEES